MNEQKMNWLYQWVIFWSGYQLWVSNLGEKRSTAGMIETTANRRLHTFTAFTNNTDIEL